MTNKAIAQALEVWRKADAEHERLNTSRTYAAEQDAWDRYAELCDEAGKCLQVDCDVHTPDYAYCPQHREA